MASSAPALSSNCVQRCAHASISSWCSGNALILEIRDGHIWARGADDDKGQAFIQVKAFEYLVKYNLLENNVKFIFEGEEEIGSPSLEAFCEEHKELLKADVILVSDTSMVIDRKSVV